MKWFVKCIKNYVTFTGRARRSEFWYFVLFNVIFSIVASLLDWMIGSNAKIIERLYGLFVFLPMLAVSVRRLHDTGRSGKILLWYFFALIAWGMLLFFTGLSDFLSLAMGDLTSLPMSFLLTLSFGGLGFFIWCVFFVIWYCTPGTSGDNAYGPDPKASEE